LVITGIHEEHDKTVYYDGKKNGDITIEPGQTKTIDLQLKGKSEEGAEREMIIIDSNASNAGKNGLFLMIQYAAK
jgi:hypothetical protein